MGRSKQFVKGWNALGIQQVPTEEEVHATIADFLNLLAGSPHQPNFIWFHVPNGGHRHLGVARKMKRMGTRKGVWDIFIIAPHGDTYALYLAEVKRPTATGERRVSIENRLSKEQKEFKRILLDYNLPEENTAVVDSVYKMKEAMKRWGLV